MSLKEYIRKRNFSKTAEPLGKSSRTHHSHRFVIQKHDASRLHYDFRLEMAGTLKSWAVPKGIPYVKGERHLAVQVEDHPVSYIDFEGTIPKGQYGGGTVMVWDRGTYEPLSDTPTKDLANGKLHVVLHGEKLKGEWYLVRLRDENQWLLIRAGSNMRPLSKKRDDQSVLSGKTMHQLATDKKSRQWTSHRNGDSDSTAPAAAKPRPRRTVQGALPRFVEPMKARLVDSVPPGDWTYEIKFDGFRALGLLGGGKVKLLSRNEKDLTTKFPEIPGALSSLDVENAIIDGEIVALDPKGISSFQLLQAYELGQERPPICYYVFDLLRLNGENLQSLPLAERKSRLEQLLANRNDSVRYSASLGDGGHELLKKAKRLGLEGLIAKRKNSVYEAGRRSGAWVKLKFHHEQEFVIGGYCDPEGSRNYFGALVIGYYEGDTLRVASKVGSGFNEVLLKSLYGRFQKIAQSDCPFPELPAKRRGRYGKGITAAEMRRCHWVKPVLVCQVKFSEWTRDGSLRQPVFLGLREDKNARDVVREKAA